MEKSTVAFFHAMNGRGTKKSLTFRFRNGGIDFASHALYVCTQHLPLFSPIIGNSGFQRQPVFGY